MDTFGIGCIALLYLPLLRLRCSGPQTAQDFSLGKLMPRTGCLGTTTPAFAAAVFSYLCTLALRAGPLLAYSQTRDTQYKYARQGGQGHWPELVMITCRSSSNKPLAST